MSVKAKCCKVSTVPTRWTTKRHSGIEPHRFDGQRGGWKTLPKVTCIVLSWPWLFHCVALSWPLLWLTPACQSVARPHLKKGQSFNHARENAKWKFVWATEEQMDEVRQTAFAPESTAYGKKSSLATKAWPSHFWEKRSNGSMKECVVGTKFRLYYRIGA